jgi:hypothetical protein
MPTALTYPGVYIEEIPSGVRTIAGVATSITAFIGRAQRGTVDQPIRVQSFAAFDRTFGGLWVDSTLGYAVAQFFANGGSDALIVRVASRAPSTVARATVGNMSLTAADAGGKGNQLTAAVSNAGGVNPAFFKLTIADHSVSPPAQTEIDNIDPADAQNRLASQIVHLDQPIQPITTRPTNTQQPVPFTGGQDAPAAATLNRTNFTFVAANEGAWGNNLLLRVEHVPTSADPSGTLFNLKIRDAGANVNEQFLNLSVDPANARFVARVLMQQSNLVALPGTVPGTRPDAHAPLNPGDNPWDSTHASTFSGGADGPAIVDNDIADPNLATDKKGLWALDQADLFNLLCIPPLTHDGGDIGATTRTQATDYCTARRALFIVDPLTAWNKPADLLGTNGVDGATFGLARTGNAALFFPYIVAPDPLRENQLGNFAPCGAVAGVMTRTDANRGVWRRPPESTPP